MGSSTFSRVSALALAGVFATASSVAGAATAQKPTAAPAAQADRPGDADAIARRRQAYEKYLEAERFERQGEYVRAVEAYKQAITLMPDSDEPRVALARLYLANRNNADAQAVINDALKVNKDSASAHGVLAEIFLMEAITGGGLDKERAKKAVAELEEVVRLDETSNVNVGNRSVKALALLGQLYKATDQDEKALATFERLSKVGEGTAETWETLARIYFEKRRYRDAARASEQAQKLDATDLDAMQILGLSLLRTGRAAEAVVVYKNMLGLVADTAKPFVTIEYADALMQAGQYQESIDTLKPILAADSKNVRALRILADAQRRSGRRDVASKTLEGALEGQDVSESIELVFALAETYEEQEQFDKAISTYEDALAVLLNPDGTVSPDDRQNASVILRRIAAAHRYAGRKEKVGETYERMRKVLGSSDPTPDLLEIQSALEETRYDDAIAQARRAGQRANDDFKQTFVFLEAQSLGRKGELAAAVKVLQDQLKGGEDDQDVYAFMAVVQLDAGDAVGAEKSIRKALERNPDDTGMLITLSSVFDKAGKYDESEATLHKVLEIDPDNATALNNLGYFLTERTKRYDEALTFIQRAVNIDPTNGSFLDSLGWVYFQLGKFADAKKYLEQAVVYEHQSSTIREHLGDLYAKLGDMTKARQYWEVALRLSNEREEIARLKGKLK